MANLDSRRWRDFQHHLSRTAELAEQVPWADSDSRESVGDLLALVHEMAAIRMAFLGVSAYGEAGVLHCIRIFHERFGEGPTIREISETLDYSRTHTAHLAELLRSRLLITATDSPDGQRFVPVEAVRAEAAAEKAAAKVASAR